MAQVPPPFHPNSEQYTGQASKRGPNPALFAFIGIFAFCAICGLMAWSMTKAALPSVKSVTQCAWRGGMSKRAIARFAKRTGKYPKAATWQDDIKPDYEELIGKAGKVSEKKIPFSDWMTSTPAGEPITCGEGKDQTCFYFNDDVAEKPVSAFGKRDKTVLVYEANKVVYNGHGKYDPGMPFVGPKFEGQPRQRIEVTIGASKGEIEIDDEPEPAAPPKTATKVDPPTNGAAQSQGDGTDPAPEKS